MRIGRVALALLAVCLLVPGFAATDAAATSFTLTVNGVAPSGGEVDLPVSTMITVLVGLDDVIAVQGYTLDITYDDAELDFVSAVQLASTEVAPGVFAAGAFTLDPTAGLTSGTSGRASVLSISSSLFIDGRTTTPSPDPREGFFALTFSIIARDDDGLADLTVGLLDGAADAIQAVGGGNVVPGPDRISLSIVPEPSTAALLGTGLFALGIATRRRRSRAARGHRQGGGARSPARRRASA